MRVVIILLALSATIFFAGCSDEKKEVKDTPRPINVVELAPSQFLSRRFPGQSRATDAVTLAFEVSGKLNEIKVDVGDYVKKGGVLASLDPRDFRNDLNVARAEVQRTSARYKRIKQAADVNAVSKQELTDALAAYNSAKAQLAIRKKALEDSVLRAPYDCLVTVKIAKSFSNVRAKEDVIRVVNPDVIEMVVDIPEQIISEASRAMNILTAFDAFPGQVFDARITEIGAEASPVTRTYPVTLGIIMPDDVQILPGMTGRAWRELSPEEKAAAKSEFIVPVTAIGEENDDSKFVWVIDADSNTASKQKIEIGAIRKDGISITGIDAGKLIAIAGVNSLKEGQKVRPVKVPANHRPDTSSKS